MRLTTEQSYALLEKRGCYASQACANVGRFSARCVSPDGMTVVRGARGIAVTERQPTRRAHARHARRSYPKASAAERCTATTPVSKPPIDQKRMRDCPRRPNYP